MSFYGWIIWSLSFKISLKLCPQVSCLYFGSSICVVFPPPSVFLFLYLTCPFTASFHLYLIPWLVCLYIVFVLSRLMFSSVSPLVCFWFLFLVVLIALYCLHFSFQPLLLLLSFLSMWLVYLDSSFFVSFSFVSKKLAFCFLNRASHVLSGFWSSLSPVIVTIIACEKLFCFCLLEICTNK